MLAELLLDAHDLEAGKVRRHDEGRHVVLLRVRIGDREDDQHAGRPAGGDELFRSAQHPVVAVAARAGLQRAGVGAGLRLGQREAADHLAARQGPEIALLLRLRAEAQDRQAGDGIVDAHDGGARAVAGRDLLQRQRIGDLSDIRAAEFLRYQHAEEAEFAHFLQRIERNVALLAPLRREGRKFFAREAAGGVADEGLFFGQHAASYHAATVRQGAAKPMASAVRSWH